LIEKRENEGE